jgi:RsiW-degrading membrane proteinase PrsW (M82 family)
VTEPSQPPVVGIEPPLVPAAPAVVTQPKPPRKWLGRKGGLIILAGFAAFWLYLLLFESLVEHEFSPSPTVIVLGGFALATAIIYTMAYRLRPQDGITVSRLLIAFLVGGLISTTIAGTANWLIDAASGGNPLHPSIVALSLAGVVEELCKILAVVIVARGLAKTARNGLFLGGAVGLGFSAIEDMEYQLRGWDVAPLAHSPLLSLIEVTVTRDIVGPMEHPVFTALFAAALFAATRRGRYRVTIGVVGTYLALAVVHGLIDSESSYLYLLTGAAPSFVLEMYIMILLVTASGIAWIVISRRINDRAFAAEALHRAETPQHVGAPPEPGQDPDDAAATAAGATDR